MNLQKLNEAIGEYAKYLRNHPQHDPYLWWESQQVFQQNWDIDALDFAAMYDSSLENSRSRRAWRRENYEPKDMMLRFAASNREFVREAFKDLFNENKAVEGRLSRFVFHCDELLAAYHEAHPNSKLNSHYHDDGYQMASLYLAFRYPTAYLPYDFTAFQRLMAMLGSRDQPHHDDVGRYFKAMRTIYAFLKKDEEILSLHGQRTDPKLHYAGETLLVAWDFLQKMAL